MRFTAGPLAYDPWRSFSAGDVGVELKKLVTPWGEPCSTQEHDSLWELGHRAFTICQEMMSAELQPETFLQQVPIVDQFLRDIFQTLQDREQDRGQLMCINMDRKPYSISVFLDRSMAERNWALQQLNKAEKTQVIEEIVGNGFDTTVCIFSALDDAFLWMLEGDFDRFCANVVLATDLLRTIETPSEESFWEKGTRASATRWEPVKSAAQAIAIDLWEKGEAKGIGDAAEEIELEFRVNPKKYGLSKGIQIKAIRKYIGEVAPAHMSKPGRRPKKQK